jgi:hypothetical protein
MRASTATHTDTTNANHLAPWSAFNPLMFELTDQVVLTFQTSDSGDAPNPATKAVNKAATKVATGGNAPSADQPVKIHGWRLTLRASPSAGDSFTIEGVLSQPVMLGPVRQRSGYAGALCAPPGKPMSGGVPLAEDHATLLSPLDTQVPSPTWAAGITAPLAIGLQGVHSEVVDASLDEETARLFQLQQSYQTAAMFLQIAQSTLDTLLRGVRTNNEDPS